MLIKLFVLAAFAISLVFSGSDDPVVDPTKDSKIDIIYKLTSDPKTNNQFPMFSKDSRLVYFQGFGDTYGTDCPHIYQLDLATNDTSLFSTGLGQEEQISEWLSQQVVVSTVLNTLKNIKDTEFKNKYFTSNDFCPTSKCPGKSGDPTFDACSGPHREHFKNEALLYYDRYGSIVTVKKSVEVKPASEAEETPTVTQHWQNPGILFIENFNVLKFAIFSQSDPNGEAVIIYDYVKKEANRMKGGFENGTFNAFFKSQNATINPNKSYFFHGYKFEDIKDKDEARWLAVTNGVIPQDGSSIFHGNLNSKSLGDLPTVISPTDATKDYVYPRAGPDKDHVLVTGYDHGNKINALYSISIKGGAPQRVSASKYDTLHGALNPTNQYIAFVSNRNDDGNQLFLGFYPNDQVAPKPEFKKIKPKRKNSPDFSKYFEQPYIYIYPGEDSWTPKISKSGMLMYASKVGTANCPQIFQIDPAWNDIQVRRKMSSGIHSYESPNFLEGSTDILYASTLTKAYDVNHIDEQTNIEKTLCPVEVCKSSNSDWENVKDLCKNVLEKSLPAQSELYISNTYGSVKQRLTNNDYYDGEAAVWKNEYVIFSSYDTKTGDVDLYKMKLGPENDLPKEKLISEYGFEGGVAFEPNGKMFTFYAYYPDNQSNKERYGKQLEKGFVDVSKTNIYAYHFESGKPVQVTKYKDGRAYSPIFISADKIVFLHIVDGQTVLTRVDLSCNSNGCTAGEPVMLEQLANNVWDLFYQPDLNKLAFSDNIGVYISHKIDVQKIIDATDTTTTTTQEPTTTTKRKKGAAAVYGPRTMALIVSFVAFVIWMV